jgi:peptidoglycan/xylan/chitin deacetylase (PgdA/CDA1 family)
LRDYGNRVGVYRLMDALDRRGLTASAAVNAAVAARHPSLIKEIERRGWEIIAHGLDMGHLHHGGLEASAEGELIDRSLGLLRAASGGRIRGWLSPAKSESFATPDLLAAAGIDYLCDWANDDMPYAMRTAAGTIHCLPHPSDIDDYAILIQNHHSEDEFRDQVLDHFEFLYREATRAGGRIMALSLHPWIIGQPYRIGTLETALDRMMERKGVWCATGAQILDAWAAQQ